MRTIALGKNLEIRKISGGAKLNNLTFFSIIL